jgi:hypothetical protein
MCSPLLDRTPISRERDCCDLTEISEISGGRQRFGLRQRFNHFEVWRAGTNSRYGTGESPPIKAGQGELIPHLRRRRTCSSAGPERSQQLQIPPSLNSKAIPQRVRLFFLLRQYFFRRQYFSRRQVFTIRLRFWMCQVFTIHLIFCMRQVFTIRLIFWMRQVFTIRLRFWMRQVFTIRQVFTRRQCFWMRQCFCIFCGVYIFVYFSAFLFSMRLRFDWRKCF